MSHSNVPDDPRCPACGEPIGATATYCMHCSTDLTELRDQADTDADGYWDSNRSGTVADVVDGALPDQAGWFHPDGLIDNTLTVVVGAVGGLVVGVIGGVVLLIVTSSGLAVPFALLAWLGSTAYLVTRRTVYDALAKTAYGTAIVLLLVPLIAFGSSSEPIDPSTRIVVFLFMLGGLVIPAAIAGGIGLAIDRYAPERDDDESATHD